MIHQKGPEWHLHQQDGREERQEHFANISRMLIAKYIANFKLVSDPGLVTKSIRPRRMFYSPIGDGVVAADGVEVVNQFPSFFSIFIHFFYHLCIVSQNFLLLLKLASNCESTLTTSWKIWFAILKTQILKNRRTWAVLEFAVISIFEVN